MEEGEELPGTEVGSKEGIDKGESRGREEVER